MLYLVGLGLGDEKDITIKGLEIVQKCSRVYLEHYTSVLTVGKESLEKFYGREVLLADRDMVEQGSDSILDQARDVDVAFLVVGDPFGATTHSDLVLRARDLGVPVAVVHNASILNAVGCCGLQLYSFGETVSVVFWTEDWRPESFFDKIVSNRRRGYHTLCLLDIKVKERTVENLMRGREIYEPPRFMTTRQAAEQFLKIVRSRRERETDKAILEEDTICVGLARIGWGDQRIIVDTLEGLASEAAEEALGPPLHSLIVPAETLHPLELNSLKSYALDEEKFDRLTKHLRYK